LELQNGATTLAAPALDPGNIVLTGEMTNAVHAMSVTNGQRNYQPANLRLTGGAVQDASPHRCRRHLQPTCKNVCAVAYVAAGDGTVMPSVQTRAPCLQNRRADHGRRSGFLAAPAVEVKSFSGVVTSMLLTSSSLPREMSVRAAQPTIGFRVERNTGNRLDIQSGKHGHRERHPYIDYVNNMAGLQAAPSVYWPAQPLENQHQYRKSIGVLQSERYRPAPAKTSTAV